MFLDSDGYLYCRRSLARAVRFARQSRLRACSLARKFKINDTWSLSVNITEYSKIA